MGLLVLSACTNYKEHDIYGHVPQGQGENHNVVIVQTEHSVQGTSTISVRVDGKFDRTTTITDDVLIEIDTLTRSDLFVLKRNVSGRIDTDIYTTVYRFDGILKFHSFKSSVTDYENERTYNLN